MNPTACMTPDGYPYLTSYPECPPALDLPTTTTTTDGGPHPLRELPQTGGDPLTLFGLALILIAVGLLALAWKNTR